MMLNSTLANGGRGWFSYTYHNTPVWVNGHYERSLTGPFLTFSDLWAELGNRIERLAALSPLFLSTGPVPPPPHLNLAFDFKRNPKSHLRKDIEAISVSWLQGPDYFLLYVINNDIYQVTSLNLSLPELLPDGLEIYETTALARIRSWEPSAHKLHFEMFPGKAVPDRTTLGLAFWCEEIARRILQTDQRQARVDLELARQYRLDLRGIENALNNPVSDASIGELVQVRDARERLFNLIYATPDICEPNAMLMKASSVICGCDEALSALHGRGRTEVARELGVKVLPLSRSLTVLRLQMRRGYGLRILPEASALVQSGTDLLREIWNQS